MIFLWSGGQKSAQNYLELFHTGYFDIAALLSVFNIETQRTFDTGIKDTIIAQQASMLGASLIKVYCKKDEVQMKVTALLERLTSKDFKFISAGHSDALKHFIDKDFHALEFVNSTPTTMREIKSIIIAQSKELSENKYLGKEFNQDIPDQHKSLLHSLVVFMPGFKKRVSYSKSMIQENEQYYYFHLRDN